jgi:hypothetical protein
MVPNPRQGVVIEEIEAIAAVVEVLDALSVPYALGGSLASAVHGVVRATLDADLVAETSPQRPLISGGESHQRCSGSRLGGHRASPATCPARQSSRSKVARVTGTRSVSCQKSAAAR